MNKRETLQFEKQISQGIPQHMPTKEQYQQLRVITNSILIM